ncbi:hypothetical protein CR513_54605, partial [Mucuna pruriens]
MVTLESILHYFELAFRLKVNFYKGKLISIEVKENFEEIYLKIFYRVVRKKGGSWLRSNVWSMLSKGGGRIWHKKYANF